ncbi:unnamed protein product [Mesocestoides corti]|uniref:SECA_MOTOR_DEAD domain-containing protein n=1 Tax=Mesocestoides corti TaxID=53468 RepID=A0A0R3U9W5_MESCO|nr:unnamed protein product [Mesocestoides corti]
MNLKGKQLHFYPDDLPTDAFQWLRKIITTMMVIRGLESYIPQVIFVNGLQELDDQHDGISGAAASAYELEDAKKEVDGEAAVSSENVLPLANN